MQGQFVYGPEVLPDVRSLDRTTTRDELGCPNVDEYLVKQFTEVNRLLNDNKFIGKMNSTWHHTCGHHQCFTTMHCSLEQKHLLIILMTISKVRILCSLYA